MLSPLSLKSWEQETQNLQLDVSEATHQSHQDDKKSRLVRPQKTLRRSIQCSGIAIHCGQIVNMTIEPAPRNVGIVFCRTDIPSRPTIPAIWNRVVDTQLNTTIANDDGVRVSTVEHIMAALAGAEIDNAFITLDGPEIPIMDGSAAPFIFLIDCAGILKQEECRHRIRILDTVKVDDQQGGWVSLSPRSSNVLTLDITIRFNAKIIGCQKLKMVVSSGAFRDSLSRARTFGLLEDVSRLRSIGLALGGSLDNAIVVNEDHVLNKEGLRYKDEFVRHKALDVLGDLALAGFPIAGHYCANHPGHKLNNYLLSELFSRPDAFCIDPFTVEQDL